MNDQLLDQDTQAILLLCGRFGREQTEEFKPLTTREYNKIAFWLSDRDLHPANLLEEEVVEQVGSDYSLRDISDRISYLLGRGAAMALAVESWTNKGIWLISRIESDYPNRLRAKLKNSAPPIIYGVGYRDLLNKGGLAVVGSRDVDEEGIAFTRELARQCAERDIQIVSGGARGVDSEAMLSVLADEGSSVGVLAHSLTQAAVSRKYREYLLSGSLALISLYDPDAGFSVGAVMGRNKYIYCLSDWSLVVSTGFEKGGTWSGAIENMKNQWTPLFVRSGPSVPDGNAKLLEINGAAMPDTLFDDIVDLGSWLREHAETGRGDGGDGEQLTLL